MKRARKVEVPLTTSQRLGSLIKAARDIMRKDKGLSGDLDRLPMLTWIFFLKFLDDMERLEEHKAALKGSKYRSAIAAPYRWRDWAAKEDGITGDELIAFVNQETAVRPDGKSGPGLFAYLRKLQGATGGDRRDVIAAVFRGTSESDADRLSPACRRQQGQRNSLRLLRRDSHARPPLRIDASGDARRRG